MLVQEEMNMETMSQELHEAWWDTINSLCEPLVAVTEERAWTREEREAFAFFEVWLNDLYAPGINLR